MPVPGLGAGDTAVKIHNLCPHGAHSVIRVTDSPVNSQHNNNWSKY